MTEVLRADSIGMSFAGRRVLTAATLRANAGEIAFLVGRNGCGKSTLLRIAAGSLTSDHGAVTFTGKTELRPHWHDLAARGLFYLLDRNLLAPTRTVRQHLAAITRQFGLPGYVAAADLCDVTALLDRRCGILSTGELRRAEVAMAVARMSDCLLADEPFRHIDPRDRSVVSAALRHLAAAGCAVVVTGHDVDDLFEVCDSVTWCTDGTTYELGTPADARTHWKFTQAYLGPARGLAAKAAARLMSLKRRRFHAQGGCRGKWPCKRRIGWSEQRS